VIVIQAPVVADYDMTHPSLPIQDFFNKVTISVASLKKDGAALKFKRAGPTPITRANVRPY
jgi:hypothetical protein